MLGDSGYDSNIIRKKLKLITPKNIMNCKNPEKLSDKCFLKKCIKKLI